MNIAVLGSNCKFSSDLAVQLNKLKQSSLVYRYDALADFKKSVPLYKSLLNNGNVTTSSDYGIDLEEVQLLNATRRPTDKSSLGEYIGDVETRFLQISEEQETVEKLKTLETIFKMLDTQIKGTKTYGEQCLLNKIQEKGKNSQLFASNLLNVINIYSGIITNKMLDVLLANDPMTVIVKVKGDGFIPCTITKEELSSQKEENPQSIVLEVPSVKELLLNNFFISAFNLNKEKKERPKDKTEEKKEAVVVDMPQRVENPPDRVVFLEAA